MRTLSSRWLVAVAGVVVALILVSVVVALVNPRGAAETLPEDTPEGIVQRFVLAVQDHDYSLAHSYLSADLKKTCSLSQIEERSYWPDDSLRDNRIALLDKQVLSDGRVQVRVRVTQVNVSPPFGVDEYSHEERFTLLQEDGEWRFAEPPWPLYWCPPIEKPTPVPEATPATLD